MPTHATSDLIVATVWRNASTTAPTIPGGWTLAKTQTATTAWLGVYYKIAASSSETTGTWTSANAIQVNVYRGANAIGGTAGGTGSSTTMSYPAVTLNKTDSTSWVFRSAGNKSATNMITNVPTGYTARGGAATVMRGCDSNAGLASSPGAGTQATSPTGIWCAISVELLMTPPPSAAISTLTDDFNTGSIPDVAKWTTTIGSPAVSAGDLVLPVSSAMDSATTYDLTADAMYVQAKAVATDVFFADASLVIGWYFSSSSVAVVFDNTGVTATTRTHTSGDWYRLRESGGTIFWDYSTNGTSWTNLASKTASSMSFPTTSMKPHFENFSAGTSAHFDNFNTAPAPSNTGAFFALF